MDYLGTGRKAALIWIDRDRVRVTEMLELCCSAGFDIVHRIGQGKDEPDPRFYLGPGKIDEVGALDVEYLITAGDLTPSQVFSISHRTGKKVADRTRVILDIFRSHAQSPEARMQVEIADLRYQLPVLKEYIHQGTLSERPGFMAGGEYAVNYYHDMIKRRMVSLKKDLEEERRRRGHKRSLRRRRGTHLVSIAGYTNAGKSSLFNKMIMSSSENKAVDVGGEMFTTISTATRKMKGERGCLVSDTVGFIRELPPWLVEGFMSTMEEIFEADAVVLVIDGSEPLEDVSIKLRESLRVLRKGGTEGRIILAVNKTDLITDPLRMAALSERMTRMLSPSEKAMVDRTYLISALKDNGISELIDGIEGLLPPIQIVSMRIPISLVREELVASLRKHSSIMEERYHGGYLMLKAMMEERWAGHFIKRVVEAGGDASAVDGSGNYIKKINIHDGLDGAGADQ
ncbi:MAG: GTPase HflX [Candidatus Thermoplasmatota archaeon]|nr:GTPase HflX [Candidatus Thermoplasmatota archaeon]